MIVKVNSWAIAKPVYVPTPKIDGKNIAEMIELINDAFLLENVFAILKTNSTEMLLKIELIKLRMKKDLSLNPNNLKMT
ncbi:MAG: hypothetical protein N2319_02830 [Candidatus Kapabacteria bacterium]|nr:hypothetical protein [Candidatus Kapabacteria bacterium]